MKKNKVIAKLKEHCDRQGYVQLTRKKGGFIGTTYGFILDMSKDFVLLQESLEFRVLGYQIIPIDTIKHVRYNKFDKTYEKVLKSKDLLKKVKLKYPIDLTDWRTIGKSIRKTGLIVISECENPKQDFFCIGELKKVRKKSLSIRYFSAAGIWNDFNTKHYFKHITILSFDDRYANVFGEYLRTKA